MNAGRPADLLFVCSGNICRSAYAALWMSHALEGRLTVASAGTEAVVDSGVHTEIERLLRQRGLPTGHVARQLTRPLVRGAGLVVGMTRAHRSSAVTMFPGALRRSVTLLEVVQLTPYLDATVLPTPRKERIRAIGPAVMGVRGSVPADESFDVQDPYGLDTPAFEHMAEVMDQALPVLRDLILGDPPDA